MGIIKKVVKGVGSLVGIGGGGETGAAAPAAQADAPVIQQANEAQVQAQNEANRIAAEQAARQQELNTMNKNYAADLSQENRAMVETAGTANEAASLDNPDQKRRKPVAGLASTLGINV